MEKARRFLPAEPLASDPVHGRPPRTASTPLRESGSCGWALAAVQVLLPEQVVHQQMTQSMAVRQNQANFPKGAPPLQVVRVAASAQSPEPRLASV